ncbi:hypothetical protein HK102_006587 [Quaeritorhiza haematococci]|nr:hypothetical protein HK102_006587 [Quaeritorhiza haematococci]
MKVIQPPNPRKFSTGSHDEDLELAAAMAAVTAALVGASGTTDDEDDEDALSAAVTAALNSATGADHDTVVPEEPHIDDQLTAEEVEDGLEVAARLLEATSDYPFPSAVTGEASSSEETTTAAESTPATTAEVRTTSSEHFISLQAELSPQPLKSHMHTGSHESHG